MEVTERLGDDIPPDALIEVARGFAELGDLKRALRIATGLEVKGSRIAALTEIANVLTASEKYKKAVDVTFEMQRKKARSAEQLKIVKVMAKNGLAEDAISLSQEIESPLYQIYGLNRIAVAITGHQFEEYV